MQILAHGAGSTSLLFNIVKGSKIVFLETDIVRHKPKKIIIRRIIIIKYAQIFPIVHAHTNTEFFCTL